MEGNHAPGAPASSAPFQTPRRPTAMDSAAFKTPLRTPLEQTSKTPIIDMALAIESQKENVIPRAKGRSASALHNNLALQHRERSEKLATQRQEHEKRIHSEENAESEDPLEAWDSYIRWTIDSYPAGQTTESGLVPLLELATRTFFRQKVYAQDVRYLRFWVLYANNCEDRRQVFKFLLSNEVGTNWATLYEELANVLEANSLYDEADETYKLGIHRRAHPLDRLNRRYKEYQQRILLRPEASGQAAANGGSGSYTDALKAAMTAAKRSMLGTKTDARSGAPSMSANTVRGGGGLSSAGLGSGGPSSSGPALAGSSSNVKKLAVYRDDDGDEPANQNQHASKTGGSEWDSLGSKVQRQQENHATAKAWAGEMMSAGTNKTPGKSGAVPVNVFRDSDDEDQAPAVVRGSADAGGRTPRARLGSGPGMGRVALAPSLSETDQLRQNPFLRWDKDLLSGERKVEAPAPAPAPAPETRKESAMEVKKSKKSKSSATSGGHKSSSSSSSRSKDKEIAAASTSKSSAGSGPRRERHAFPILLLYPHLATLEEVVTSFEKGMTRWTEPSLEVCIEEILLTKRGISSSADSDPWAYLDERVGVSWPPKIEAKAPELQRSVKAGEDVVMTNASSSAPSSQEGPASTVSTSSSQERPASMIISSSSQERPATTISASSSQERVASTASASSSQERTGSHKRKREGDGHTGTSNLKVKPKPREVTQTVTMFTKAAELDVRDMFNGDDSEDSGDDDDDDDDEESDDEFSHRRGPVPPTPSARHVSGPSVMPATPASQRQPVDENGDPLLMSGRRMPSVSRSGGGGGVLAPRVLSDPLAALGTVSATPIRAPLVARIPFEKVNVPGSSSVPVPAPALSAAPVMMGPPPVPRAVSASGAMRVPQKMEVFREEEEEEEEAEEERREGEESVGPKGPDGDGEEQEDQTPEEENPDDLLINGTHVYHALTPITEATEFTRFTARTARTPGTASKPSRTDMSQDVLDRWNHSRRGSARGSLAGDDEDSSSEDETVDSQIPKLMVLTDAQRQQMQKDPSSVNVSGSLSELGPSSKAREGALGPTNSISEEASTSIRNDIADRSDASSHGFPVHSDKPLEPTGLWDRPRASAGELSALLIEQNEHTGASAAPPTHLDFGSSLVISEYNQAGGESILPEGAEDGEHIIANPCPPVDAKNIAHILSRLEHKIEDLPHFIDFRAHSAGGILETLQSAVRSATRKSLGGASIAKNGQVKIQCQLDIAGAPFHVIRKLGEGGYGAVFLADDITSFAPSLRPQLCMVEPEDSMDIDDDDAKRKVAMKIESPPNAWEFYVLHQLEMRLPPYVLPSLISARKLIAYEDESFLLLHYGDKGTLLDVVNGAVGAGVASSGASGASGSTGVDEVLAMFFTIELIRIVEQMHHCRFVHGDIKIDNCLLRLDEVLDESEWTPKYSASGTGCWAAKGMILIDFGRAIDLSCYPEGQTFVADWEADERDCMQMREGKPWVYEVDYFGIAAVAHCLLFGKYIETHTAGEQDGQEVNGAPRLVLSQPLRRYWQGELWGKLFDLLLNPAAVTGKASFEPIIEELAEVRGEMESWLEVNSHRAGKNLRGMLKKLELWAMKRNE
ncbi:hypothetical protein CF327_g1881 [Tilletia walkeri]|nr:hypothetical protein CF327_g1881 [Tilletia walkeri]